MFEPEKDWVKKRKTSSIIGRVTVRLDNLIILSLIESELEEASSFTTASMASISDSTFDGSEAPLNLHKLTIASFFLPLKVQILQPLSPFYKLLSLLAANFESFLEILIVQRKNHPRVFTQCCNED